MSNLRTAHYKRPMNKKEWKRYAQLRKQYESGEISHARFVFMRGIVLETGSFTNLSYTYDPYFCAIMGKEEGEKSCTDERIADILSAAKKRHAEMLKKNYLYSNEAEIFMGFPVEWEYFRPGDEEYNSYDCFTEKVTLPWKLSKEEEKDFREQFRIEFHDPYGDGRDCTGAPFTGWMRFLRCKDRTIILHRVKKDL